MLSLSALTGCTNRGTENALTISGVDIRAGVYLSYMLTSYYEATTLNTDSSKKVLSTEIEGKPAAEWIIDDTIEACREHVAVLQWFDELGLQLSEDDLAVIEYNVKSSLAQGEDFFNRNGIGAASLRELITASFKRQKIYEHFYAVGGVKGVTEDDVKTYFSDSYAEIRMMTFSYTNADKTAMTDAQRAERKALAQGFLARANAEGSDFSALLLEQAVWSSETYGTEFDPATFDPEVDYRIVTKAAPEVPQAIATELFKTAVGKASLAEDSTGVVVFQRTDVMRDPSTLDDYREDCVNAMNSEAFATDLKPRIEAAEVVRNERAISRYAPKNIKEE